MSMKKEMEIAHPAARMVVMAAQMQEQEIGDGSNYVVIFAGELLHQAEALIRMGLPVAEIISGYTKAGKQAVEILESMLITLNITQYHNHICNH
jgi:T-complex protein 1 subunit theta